MAGPTIGTTQLNPASPGGPAVAVDTSSVPGQLVPVSDLMVDGAAVSAVGGVALPVGGVGQSTGTSAPIAIDQSAGANRALVSDAELLTAVHETNRLLRALVRGLSMQLEGYDLLQEEM